MVVIIHISRHFHLYSYPKDSVISNRYWNLTLEELHIFHISNVDYIYSCKTCKKLENTRKIESIMFFCIKKNQKYVCYSRDSK